MVDDDDGWSFVGFLIGSETVIATDGSDSVTCTDSGTTVSTTGSGMAFCGKRVVWVCVMWVEVEVCSVVV